MRVFRNIFWFLWGLALSAIVAAVLQVSPASAQTRSDASRGGAQAPAAVPEPIAAPPARAMRGTFDPVRDSGRRNGEGETQGEVEDGEASASSAEPATDETGAEPLQVPAGMRPAVQDGDVLPPDPTAPQDGIPDVGEPQVSADGVDPTRIDTRTADEIAAFETPPSEFDALAFQIEDIDPILDRRPSRLARFEPYDPVGIKLGTFVLYPELEVAGLATRNAQFSPQPRGDVAIEAKPSMRLVSDWRTHALELRASGNFSAYNRFSSEDNRGYHLETRGRIDVTRRTNIQLELARDVAQESRQVLESSRTGTRADVTTDEFRGAVNHRFNRLSLQLRGSVSDIAYGAVEQAGVVSTNDDRNYLRSTEALRATWEFKPTLLGFAEVGLDQRGYKTVAFSDGISRSSRGERYRVGVSFGNVSAILRGEASLGWGRQAANDDRLKEVSGVLIDANLSWKVTALTTALFTARSEFNESNIAGTAGSISRSGGVELRHSLSTNLIGSAGFSITNTAYSGVSIEERDIRGTLGVEYYLSRETVLFGRYQHTAFDTTSVGGSYSNDEFRVGVRLRR